jgi:acetyl/propionyl-CoA carboxylase alpha subunit
MQAALREFVVHGVVTNIDFLQDVLSHPDFANGEVTTRWVETKFNWTPPSEPCLNLYCRLSHGFDNRKSQI